MIKAKRGYFDVKLYLKRHQINGYQLDLDSLKVLQWMVYYYHHDELPVRSKKLAEDGYLDTPDMVKILRLLRSQGLIDKQRCKDDERQVEISMNTSQYEKVSILLKEANLIIKQVTDDLD